MYFDESMHPIHNSEPEAPPRAWYTEKTLDERRLLVARLIKKGVAPDSALGKMNQLLNIHIKSPLLPKMYQHTNSLSGEAEP